MIETANEPPCLGPCKRFQIQVANVIQYVIVLTSNTANYKKLIFVKGGRMSCSALWDRSGYLGLSPVCRLKIENDEVCEIRAVFVFAAKNQQFVALVECGSVS